MAVIEKPTFCHTPVIEKPMEVTEKNTFCGTPVIEKPTFCGDVPLLVRVSPVLTQNPDIWNFHHLPHAKFHPSTYILLSLCRLIQ